MTVAQSVVQSPVRAKPVLKVAQKGVWAFGDQVIISGSNFATMVLCARGMSQAEFGAFSLVYSALLLINTLQTSLINQPHNVIGSTRPGEAYLRYTSATALMQLMVTGAAVGISVLVAVMFHVMGSGMARLLMVLPVAILAWQFQEFARRVMYTERRFFAAFVNDVICYIGQAVILAGMFLRDEITGESALLVVAGTSGIAAVHGAFLLRRSLVAKPDFSAIKENWHFGKWLAGADLLNWCSSIYLYQYVVALMLGTAATGVLKAAQTVFGPARVIVYFLATVLPMRFARTLSEEGFEVMHVHMKRLYLLLVPVLGSYCAAIALSSHWILRVLFGEKYAHFAPVLSLFAMYQMMSYVELGMIAVLSARRQTRYIFTGYIWGGAISISIGWLLIRELGLNGAIVGMMLTTLLVSMRLIMAYRHELRTSRLEACV